MQAAENQAALAAFRTALRLMPNCHLPPLALATLASRSGHLQLSKQYLDLSTALCASDPRIYHEAGVLEYRMGAFHKAVGLFHFALSLVGSFTMPAGGAGAGAGGAAAGSGGAGAAGTAFGAGYLRRSWEPTMVNLAHAYRRLG